MTPEQIGFLIGSIGGALFAGAICGLIPYGVGKWMGRVSLGVAGLITSVICGAILGVILAGPVAVVFSLAILILGRPTASRSVPGDMGSSARRER